MMQMAPKVIDDRMAYLDRSLKRAAAIYQAKLIGLQEAGLELKAYGDDRQGETAFDLKSLRQIGVKMTTPPDNLR